MNNIDLNGRQFLNLDVSLYEDAIKSIESGNVSLHSLSLGRFFGNKSLIPSIHEFCSKNVASVDVAKVYCKVPCIYIADKSEVLRFLQSSIDAKGYCNVCWFNYSGSNRALMTLPYNPTLPTDYIHCLVVKGILYLVDDFGVSFSPKVSTLQYFENNPLTGIFYIVPNN